ncbi:hypothetical protein PZB74_17050 [Porifericola rhodea]|uniref:hypothetical protein n=1 Tax=Porifericola rhodea TaxID=930972 RepID=UPI002665F314|nr:hypothetical protein [Porifericola rhodea]WKN30667.1 hypothetical protein PZB74_17050 [Porifericola rhodea]
MKQLTFLHKANLSIQVALKESEISAKLKEYGYDDKKIKEGEKICNLFSELSQKLEEARENSKVATLSLQSTRKHIHTSYSRHVALTRIALRDVPQAIVLMGLKGRREITIDGWLEQTRNYYHYAMEHADVLKKYGIPKHELQENQILLGQMIELLTLQKQTYSQAQVLAQQKQEAFSSMQQWYSKFIKLARLALDEKPQQLEALGILVRNEK